MSRIVILLANSILIIFGLVACQPASSGANNASTAANSNTTSNVAAQRGPSPTPSQSPTASPLEVATRWQEAINKGDMEGYKKSISERTMKDYEDCMSRDNKTLDECIKGSSIMVLAKNLFPIPLKVRNEVIEGDTATLHTMDRKGQIHWVTLLRENGEWKLLESATLMPQTER
jgi:hypothetical protein